MPFVTIMVAHNVGLTVTTSGTRGRIALPEHHTAGLPRIGKDMLVFGAHASVVHCTNLSIQMSIALLSGLFEQ